MKRQEGKIFVAHDKALGITMFQKRQTRIRHEQAVPKKET